MVGAGAVTTALAEVSFESTVSNETPGHDRKKAKAPETTVSLTQEEEVVSDLEKSPPSSFEDDSSKQKKKKQQQQQIEEMNARVDMESIHDDEDSSDDESSYFADPSNLPQPGSGRRYSWSSADHARMHMQRTQSDASLSLSDDSDEDAQPTAPHHAHHHSDSNIAYYHTAFQAPTAQLSAQPFVQQPPTPTTIQQPMLHPSHVIMRGDVPEIFPQPIVRRHSISSLASTSSHNSEESDSSTSVRDELNNVATTMERRGTSRPTPSGRRSPILGEHAPTPRIPPFTSPSTVFGPSPPTILQAPYPGILPHPQPWTPEDRAAYAAGAANSLMQYYPPELISKSTMSRESLAYSEMSGPSPQNRVLGQQPNRMSRTSEADERLSRGRDMGSSAAGGSGGGGPGGENEDRSMTTAEEGDRNFKVYWQRWIMLFVSSLTTFFLCKFCSPFTETHLLFSIIVSFSQYMSTLNLLSDWTCYSVAPIALLTEEAFGSINPEQLVVVFLFANGIATACEPILLSRLGLRRTVLFGALLLMVGSIVKSGGMPPIIRSNLQKGHGEWKVYLGFFLVGLSQPLYQCTPALLSASWFPEVERTMATGVALNANQLGIGFAFIFGTLLVENSDDIPQYFGLLSVISTLTFLGTLIQFDDAPPTPPSETARVMRGSLEVNLPSVETIVKSVHNSVRFIGGLAPTTSTSVGDEKQQKEAGPGSRSVTSLSDDSESRRSSGSRSRRGRRISLGSPGRHIGHTGARRRNTARSQTTAATDSGITAGSRRRAPSPSSAPWDSVSDRINRAQVDVKPFPAPSPMPTEQPIRQGDVQQDFNYMHQLPPYAMAAYPAYPVNESGMPTYPYPGYPPQYWDPRFHPQYDFYSQQAFGETYSMPPADAQYQYYSYQDSVPPFAYYGPPYYSAQQFLPSPGEIDEGAEPILTFKPHQLDIDIRDDQVWLSIKACMSRSGFMHSLVAFTVSGIVINTLSTFMDYLVRLNGAPRMYTGIVGGSFQFAIMIASLIIGKVCDKTRAYYSVTIGMLVLGAFGLAECGVSLDADDGTTLRLALVIVAVLVGPLQPVSTELGVDVAYPLSENTVLVIQQLFSNVLSAMFIPCFKAMKDFGAGAVDDTETERPQYTFSFYLLIVLHATATVFFATFNGRYLRYEAEVQKKEIEERRKITASARAFRRIGQDQQIDYYGEQIPLIQPAV